MCIPLSLLGNSSINMFPRQRLHKKLNNYWTRRFLFGPYQIKRQFLGLCNPQSLLDNGSVNTVPRQRRIVRCVVFYAVRAISKESKCSVFARPSCFPSTNYFCVSLVTGKLNSQICPPPLFYLCILFLLLRNPCVLFRTSMCWQTVSADACTSEANTVYFCSWILPIALLLFQNTTFRRLDSVSVSSLRNFVFWNINRTTF
jgi:hypothetical protein